LFRDPLGVSMIALQVTFGIELICQVGQVCHADLIYPRDCLAFRQLAGRLLLRSEVLASFASLQMKRCKKERSLPVGMNSSILGRARSTFEVNNTKRYAVEAKRATVVRPSAEAWKIKFRILAGLIAVCRFAVAQHPSSAGGSAEHHSDVEITWHILKPVELAAPDLRQLHVPDGFRIQRFAENVGNARILAIGPNGNVYVTRREQGDVFMFHSGANGLADGKPVRVASRSGLHGIAFSKGKVYLASVHEVFKADVRPDGTFGPLEMIIHDLPDAGQHNTRTVQIGPDDMMYISVGSTCNECAEANPENATILRASLDGKTRSIFASGLRDTVSWGWQPVTGELWGMDNGMDALGDNVQAEELNHIERGKRYGWPYLFGDNQPNPHLGGCKKDCVNAVLRE
jgi:hypothetical protein